MIRISNVHNLNIGQQGDEGSSTQDEQVAVEDKITPERQQEIESAVHDILTDDVEGVVAQQNDKPQVEGEENNVEEIEAPKTGDSGNKRPVYQEMLKNKQIVFVAGKLG